MLPKIDVPIYETKLISNGKTIRYRPFLVKEQKLFLMASQSDDVKETINTIKQVINNCVLDDINVEELSTFDIEFIFLQLRARSVGEVINLKFNCNNLITDEKGEKDLCGNLVKFDLNLLEIQPTLDSSHTNTIQITDKIGLVMKYPTFNMVNKLDIANDDMNQVLEIIVNCIDYIYEDEKIFYSKDTSKKELIDFIENLKQFDLEKIQNFFNTLPKIKKELPFKCDKCGYEEEILLEGIQNFFV